MTGHETIRTAIRDEILDGVSAGLDGEAVRGVEWAASRDTRFALIRGQKLVDFDVYNRACEVV